MYSPTIQKDILENTDLNYDAFFEYGIPLEISVESEPGEEGELGFIFTTPKLS